MRTTLGERIALSRGRARLSQQELADAVGVSSHSQVSNWEKNKRIPSGEVMMQLPNALGVDGHWLLTGETPEDTDEGLRIAAALRVLEGEVDDLTLKLVARPADEAGALELARETLRIAGAQLRPSGGAPRKTTGAAAPQKGRLRGVSGSKPDRTT